jgi:hypothetical protein
MWDSGHGQRFPRFGNIIGSHNAPVHSSHIIEIRGCRRESPTKILADRFAGTNHRKALSGIYVKRIVDDGEE